MEIEGNRGRGRPPGSKNKATQKAKAFFADLLEKEIANGNIKKALDTVRVDEPKEYLKLMSTFAEFHMPKMSRVDADVSVRGSISIIDEFPNSQ